MIIKRGVVVSHPGAMEWGVGKVMEVERLKATIQFSDGIIRKIAASHYNALLQADATAFVELPESSPAVKVRATTTRAKKIKQAVSETA